MDLTTPYMGLMLKNPLIASASPLNSDLGNLRRLEDAGAAAVVLPSIFEEQIMAERREIELSTNRRLPASSRRKPISRRASITVSARSAISRSYGAPRRRSVSR